ncbi:TRAP transporter substrate-binding protein [Pseudooceanicola sp. CBS1P-1]|uniref:C4-dicarboxylate ABC transporter substrate-binding protein n=1 Tax=Pseudooceanicola albus TaxID=2692189 RepID=A0A6L7G2E0_9RHOB|nr:MULTISPECIES: TRAP transporter substrate-binding protein [Pseudooceanicola]MBT9384543.1 TRAP transporter substrate-binding protein [Pseudooceanicola endophyticus]MXN18245.1 C4-dicarboxylate ABC transporter substrate-binding protein [Pseudooceanicola albus]
MKKLLLSLAALLVAGPLSAKDYRLGLITPPPHQWTLSAQAAADEIAARTGGRVHILVFPSGQLGNEARMLQQLQTGAIDFAMMTVGEFANRDPNYGIFQAPYIAADYDAAGKLLSGPTAQQLLEGMRAFGLKGLAWGMAGFRQIVTGPQVDTADQLRHMKIRTVPMQSSMAFWSDLGAAPTPMPLPALYDAFANGQIDGMQIDYEGTWNSGYHDHAGTIIASNHMLFPMAAVASGRKWQTISAADRAVVQEVFADQAAQLIASYQDIDAGYLARLETTGVPVLKVDRAWFGPAIDAWYGEWEQKAPLLKQLEAEAAQD